MALSEARRKWVEDQVATAVGQSEQQFKLLAKETAARRRREVAREAAQSLRSWESRHKLSALLCSYSIALGQTTPLVPWAGKRWLFENNPCVWSTFSLSLLVVLSLLPS